MIDELIICCPTCNNSLDINLFNDYGPSLVTCSKCKFRSRRVDTSNYWSATYYIDDMRYYVYTSDDSCGSRLLDDGDTIVMDITLEKAKQIIKNLKAFI